MRTSPGPPAPSPPALPGPLPRGRRMGPRRGAGAGIGLAAGRADDEPLGLSVPAGFQLQTFAAGWLRDQRVLGRPVDVIVGLDGALYVSDQGGGRICRLSHRP